jgi:hypothetical protein
MSIANAVSQAPDILLSKTLPATFLNAYQLINADELAWPVNVYAVDINGATAEAQEQRGYIKNLMWDLRKQHKNQCRGFGFIIDITPRLVVVPQSWNFPVPITDPKYSIDLERSFVARATEPKDRPIITGILREAIKSHFKNKSSAVLGNLWQDYNNFCQYPTQFGDEYLNCRRFGFAAKVLRDGRWVLRLTVGTMTLDGNTFKTYYDEGKVAVLAERLETKRGQRITRSNRPAAVRVLHQVGGEGSPFKCMDLEDFDLVLRHATLSRNEQQSLASSTLRCKSFGGPDIDLPLSEMRLFLSSEITQEDHAETIIEPVERERLTHELRNFIDGTEIFGHHLRLSDIPVDVNTLETCFTLPPAVRVKGPNGSVEIIDAPKRTTEAEIRDRAQVRSNRIRQNGFLVQRPINPLLAWPSSASDRAGQRMRSDLNFICQSQGLPIKFGLFTYKDVEQIARHVADRGYDAVMGVMPESSRQPFTADNTHEKLKRRLEVPSQCIQYDHTLPQRWVDKPARAFKEADGRLSRRIRQMYELCLLNLLVKHHWFPFAPASPFNYNVQVGLDVGGVHNTHAMACLGYGFKRPTDLLIFRPEEIPIEFQKKEPIPTDSLFRGLLSLFDLIIAELQANDLTPDFETVLFYRDGKLLGDGDSWNEREALHKLHQHYLSRGIVTANSVWTAVEIMKGAEGWRIFRNGAEVTNPLIGLSLFPFDDDQTAIVCTTGAPFLTQGTACPLLTQIIDIHNHAHRNHVIQDLIWQSDLCFTKPDMGMSLPWVLNVADNGALHLSRSYKITGITT